MSGAFPIQRIELSCYAGETIDLAIKISRAHTGLARGEFGGGQPRSHTGLAFATEVPEQRDPLGPTPATFRQVPYNDLAALQASLNGEPPAVVLLEAIPATLGIRRTPETVHEFFSPWAAQWCTGDIIKASTRRVMHLQGVIQRRAPRITALVYPRVALPRVWPHSFAWQRRCISFLYRPAIEAADRVQSAHLVQSRRAARSLFPLEHRRLPGTTDANATIQVVADFPCYHLN